jgi:hypothetical protein
MAGNVSGLHVFAADTGPEALSLLDTNYAALTAPLNTLANFSNAYIDSGAVNASIVTVAAPQVFAYVDGIILQVKIAVTNTSTAPTINVNGLGAKTIVNPDGSTLAIGALVGGGWALLQYEGTSGKFQLLNSGSVAPGKFADGAANAPSITFASALGTGFYKAGTDILGISTANVSRGTVNAAGTWNIPAANAFTTLILASAATFYGMQINSNTAAGQSRGIIMFSGTNSADDALSVNNAAGTVGYFDIRGDGLIRGGGPTAGALVDMTPDTGTFTITYTGMTAAITGTATWSRVGKLVTLYLPSATGTSNSASFTMTGLPAAITPATLTQRLAVAQHALFDNGGGLGDATIQIAAGTGLITCYLAGNSGTWTAAGTKGAGSQFTVSYLLN